MGTAVSMAQNVVSNPVIGNNGVFTSSQLDEILRIVGPNRRIFYLNVAVPRRWTAPNNAVILDGAFLCSRAAVPFMIAAGDGVIVNIGGVSAHIGAVERAHVSAAKAGLVGLTKALAVELGRRALREVLS